MKNAHRETIQEYLSRGGVITKCDRSPRTRIVSAAPPTVGEAATEQTRTNISWSHYLAQLINDDKLGSYCAWSLMTKATLDVITPLLHRRCLVATNLHNPTPRRQLNRAELERWSRSQIAHRGTMVFILPATSVEGVAHFHGLIRTPREFCDVVLPLNTYVNGTAMEVMVPQEVAFVFGAMRGDHKGNDLLRNINLTHDKGRAVLLHVDSVVREKVLSYYQKTSDGEVRDFTNAHFVPHIIRKALPNANTTRERRVS